MFLKQIYGLERIINNIRIWFYKLKIIILLFEKKSRSYGILDYFGINLLYILCFMRVLDIFNRDVFQKYMWINFDYLNKF